MPKKIYKISSSKKLTKSEQLIFINKLFYVGMNFDIYLNYEIDFLLTIDYESRGGWGCIFLEINSVNDKILENLKLDQIFKIKILKKTYIKHKKSIQLNKQLFVTLSLKKKLQQLLLETKNNTSPTPSTHKKLFKLFNNLLPSKISSLTYWQIKLEIFQLLNKSEHTITNENINILNLTKEFKYREIYKILILKNLYCKTEKLKIWIQSESKKNNFHNSSKIIRGNWQQLTKNKSKKNYCKLILEVTIHSLVYIPFCGQTRTNFVINLGKSIHKVCDFKLLNNLNNDEYYLGLGDKIYNFVLNMLNDFSGLIVVEEKLNTETNMIHLNINFTNHKNSKYSVFLNNLKIHEKANTTQNNRYPMLVCPKKWKKQKSNLNDNYNYTGGYLVNGLNLTHLQGSKIIVSGTTSYGMVQSKNNQNWLKVINSKFYKAINHLQSQPFQINHELWNYIVKNHLCNNDKLNFYKSEIEKKTELIKIDIEFFKKELKTLKDYEKLQILSKYNNLSKFKPTQKLNQIQKQKLNQLQILLNEKDKLVKLYDKGCHELLLVREFRFFHKFMKKAKTKNIYFPHVCDYRGRLHSISSLICPQKSKWIRCVLYSNTKYKWNLEICQKLKIVAVRYYNGTRSNNDHCVEYFDNFLLEKIKNFKQDPTIYLWANQKEEMLSFCWEWNKYEQYKKKYPNKNNFQSQYMFSLDATSSALQIKSLLTKTCDKDVLCALNLVKVKNRSPVGSSYSWLIKTFIENLLQKQKNKEIKKSKKHNLKRMVKVYNDYERFLKSDVNLMLNEICVEKFKIILFLRKMFKTSIMTVSYGVSLYNFNQYSVDKLKILKDSTEFNQTYNEWENEIKFLVGNLSNFYLFLKCGQVFKFNNLLVNIINNLNKEGKPIKIKTKFHQWQQLNFYKKVKKFKSRSKKSYNIQNHTNKINFVKQKNSITANFVQSFESVCLIELILFGIENKIKIFTIHDSVIINACDIDKIKNKYPKILKKCIYKLKIKDFCNIFSNLNQKQTNQMKKQLLQIWIESKSTLKPVKKKNLLNKAIHSII